MIDKRKDCPMRHENGNCTVAGGFCTAVSAPICDALHNAFNSGYYSALHDQEDKKRNDPLTIEELKEMNGEPVWIKLFDPDEEFWALRNEWVDTRNPEPLVLLHMRWYSHTDYGKTWMAYRYKPEENNKENRQYIRRTVYCEIHSY